MQERAFCRVGGERSLPFTARLVCATNRDLEEDVRRGRFREDLYYRVNVIPVTVPPLRERHEDILPLLQRYLRTFAERFGSPARRLTVAAEEFALEWPWPGNVRELVNRVERAVALADSPQIGVDELFPERAAAGREEDGGLVTLSEVRDAAEKRHIERVLARTGGRIAETARLLGISRTTLWEKMRRYGIAEPHAFPTESGS